ncbi:unnamed protein product, partial [Prorocentrum cordatum]
ATTAEEADPWLQGDPWSDAAGNNHAGWWNSWREWWGSASWWTGSQVNEYADHWWTSSPANEGEVWVTIQRPRQPPLPHGLMRGAAGSDPATAQAPPSAPAPATPPARPPAVTMAPAQPTQPLAAAATELTVEATQVPPPPRPWAPTDGGSTSTWRPSDTQGPQPWGGFEHLETYVVALRRWSRRTGLPAEQQAGKVIDGLPVDMQERLLHYAEELDAPGGIEVLIDFLKRCRGDQDGDEAKESFRLALEDTEMRAGESYTQYVMRRDLQVKSAKRYGLELPEQVQVQQLRSGANLSEQNAINLLSITQGREDLESIKQGLKKMDVKKKSSQKKSRVYAVGHDEDEDDEEVFGSSEVYLELEEDLILDTEDALAFYEAIANQELDEDQAAAVLAAVLDEKRTKEGRPRKWAESRELKKAIARDRDFFDSKRAGGRAAPRPPAGKQRLSIARLKERTRCANCGQKGHWRKECTNPYKPKQIEQRPKKELGGKSLYVAADLLDEGDGTFLVGGPRIRELFRNVLIGESCDRGQVGHGRVLADQPLRGGPRSKSEEAILGTFILDIEGDEPEGMVDTAAGQALVGEKQLKVLQEKYYKKGWRIPVRKTDGNSSAKGIGGRSRVVGEAMVPVTSAGIRCLILFRVIAEDVPLLLPVRWMESLGAVVNLAEDKITLRFEGLDRTVKLTRQRSGHRTMALLDESLPGDFDIPEGARRDWPGLENDTFRVYRRSSSLKREGGSRKNSAPGTPRPTVTFSEPMDTSWERLPGSDLESEGSEQSSPPLQDGAASTRPTPPSPPQPTSRPHIGLQTSSLRKAWKRMTVKLMHVADVGQATKMIQEMRDEATGKMNALECPHPPWAHWESGNQHMRYVKCLRCSSMIWRRDLTHREKQAQQLKKVEREARRAARTKQLETPPWEPPKVEGRSKEGVKRAARATPAASSGSADTTVETSSSDLNQMMKAIQTNSEVVSQLALAIQQLVQKGT